MLANVSSELKRFEGQGNSIALLGRMGWSRTLPERNTLGHTSLLYPKSFPAEHLTSAINFWQNSETFTSIHNLQDKPLYTAQHCYIQSTEHHLQVMGSISFQLLASAAAFQSIAFRD
eukprot:644602-Amphidinium_carterae.1